MEKKSKKKKKGGGMKAKNDKRNGKFGTNDGVWQLERRKKL